MIAFLRRFVTRKEGEKQDDNMLTPEVIRDPYPCCTAVRERAPMYWNKQYRAWVVMRYADVVQGLRDPILPSDCVAQVLNGMALDAPLHSAMGTLSFAAAARGDHHFSSISFNRRQLCGLNEDGKFNHWTADVAGDLSAGADLSEQVRGAQFRTLFRLFTRDFELTTTADPEVFPGFR